LFVECQRVFSESMMQFVDKVRFGEVALKLMQLYPRNSLLQYVVCRAVETGLISDAASDISATHWLVRSKLVQHILHVWQKEQGDTKWRSPSLAQTSPHLSSVVHLACCVMHWMAMLREKRGLKNGRDPVEDYMQAELRQLFEAFFARSIAHIMDEEARELCGPKPRRGSARSQGSGLGGSFGLFGNTSGAMLKRNGSVGIARGNGAHLVRSACAHRFGYVPPSAVTRSRYDELFADDVGRAEVNGPAGVDMFPATRHVLCSSSSSDSGGGVGGGIVGGGGGGVGGGGTPRMAFAGDGVSGGKRGGSSFLSIFDTPADAHR